MNRHIALTVGLVLAAAASATARINVDKIDPPHWWAGMHDSSLQLQIHGRDIRTADVTTDYPGVTVDSVVRLDGSPNWLHVYLNVSPQAQPGEMTLIFRDGKQTLKKKYSLRQRDNRTRAQGFTPADVLYLIMPDRFADGNTANNRVASMRFPVGADRSNLNTRHGGDLAGIARHIAYIDSLGATAVWLNPVLENDMPGGSYHGYATTDYYRIDPRLGTNAEYAALIDTLHNHGIKTVMDMIFNHSGSEHPWKLDPPSADWYHWPDTLHVTNHKLSTITDPYASTYDRTLATDGAFVAEMPDLNQLNPHLMKYLIQNSIWWIEESGIDGIRMDTYPYADAAAMGRWNDAVMAEYPDFNIVGEAWFAEPALVATWQKGSALNKNGDTRLPTVMDFNLMLAVRNLAPFKEQTDGWNGLSKIYDHFGLDYIYPDTRRLLRFLDNHDTERLIADSIPADLGGWKQAVALLLTAPGIPQIYYGTELLMNGDRKPGDGNIRRDMPGGFPDDTTDVFTRAGRTPQQNEAYDFMSRLMQWRKGSKAVAEGDMKHFFPENGLYVYTRRTPGEQVTVVMNGRDTATTADMSRYAEISAPGAKATDVLTGRSVTLVPEGDDKTMTFAPREILILESKK